MRAWYSEDMAVGLLYKCALGDIQPDAPVGEIVTPHGAPLISS